MSQRRTTIFVAGVVLGAAATFFICQRKTTELPLTPAVNDDSGGQPAAAIVTTTESDLLELARLRGEVTRLRRENSDLQSASSATSRTNETRQAERQQPTFEYPFLTRSTWTNVGFSTPSAAIQTFFSALAGSDQAGLVRASALQTNGQPFVLTGMSTDWAERLAGAQVLSIAIPDLRNFDVAHATIVTETWTASDAGDRLTHDVVTFRLRREDGEWKFAGRVR